MELAARTRVPFPRPVVFATYRDLLPQVTPFLPNVSSIEVRERSGEGARVRMVNVWKAKTDLPAIARRFVRDEMLMWTDTAEWDQPGWLCRWRIETHALPGLVECAGTTAYHEAGDETEVEIRGELILHLEKAHVPRLLAGTVQPVIEKVIVGALKPNLLSTGDGVARYLASRPPR